METVLGWCVVGSIGSSCKGDDVISCNRIVVQDAETKMITRHYFEIQKEVKETGISDMMERMYQLDFIEARTKFKDFMTKRLDEISYEDKKFLKITEDQVVKVGNHCETALPLRNPEMTLPNNRVMVRKLKSKFHKDEQCFSHYKDFMDKIIERGYARVSDRTPVDGKLWCLPHHGVYHPTKPNKIHVVFGCSAEYAGRSVNKELLVQHDLTNQIIGILIRFRQGRVTFVADIEKMFFQVLFSKEHRSLLSFSWWQEGDLPKKLIDHEMCVHVFCGTSSPSCSNYVLKRTSVDGEDQFGKT